jgi:hypothetical protein
VRTGCSINNKTATDLPRLTRHQKKVIGLGVQVDDETKHNTMNADEETPTKKRKKATKKKASAVVKKSPKRPRSETPKKSKPKRIKLATLETPTQKSTPENAQTYTFGGVDVYDHQFGNSTIHIAASMPIISSIFRQTYPEWFSPSIEEHTPVNRWIVSSCKTIIAGQKGTKNITIKAHEFERGMDLLREGSLYCHCCKSITAPRLLCSSCNKSICLRCILKNDFGNRDELIYNEQIAEKWKCSHCIGNCPISSGCRDKERKGISEGATPKKKKKKIALSDSSDSEVEEVEAWEDTSIDRQTGLSKFKVNRRTKKLVQFQSALAFAQFLFTCVEQNRKGEPIPEQGNDRTFVDMFGNTVDEVPALKRGFKEARKDVAVTPTKVILKREPTPRKKPIAILSEKDEHQKQLEEHYAMLFSRGEIPINI